MTRLLLLTPSELTRDPRARRGLLCLARLDRRAPQVVLNAPELDSVPRLPT